MLSTAIVKKLGEEIRQVLTQVRRDVREKIEQAAAPKAAVTCPCCGATTTPMQAVAVNTAVAQ